MVGLLFILLSTEAFAVAHAGTEVPEDQELRRELNGVWCASDDGGKTCWGFDHFVDEKTIEACGRIPETGQTFHTKGWYEVRGRSTCIVVTESDDPKAFPIGTRFCSYVLHINASQQRFRLQSTGEEETTYRRPLSAMQCPTRSAAT